MTVGFNSTFYVATEKEGQVTLCVEVLNTDNVGALQPFTVALRPVQGILVKSRSLYKHYIYSLFILRVHGYHVNTHSV